MAATPKRKHSTQRQGKRRSQLKTTVQKHIKCKNCGQEKLAHFVCPNCHQ